MGFQYPGKLPSTTNGSHEEMTTAWHGLQDEIQEATSIVIAGSGPTGVESARETSSCFDTRKEITLIVEHDLPNYNLRKGFTC
jgi:NADH dehydrogenase FAD-containing subunit